MDNVSSPTSDMTEVIARLRSGGVSLTVDGGVLVAHDPTSSATPELRALVSDHRAELVAYLTPPTDSTAPMAPEGMLPAVQALGTGGSPRFGLPGALDGAMGDPFPHPRGPRPLGPWPGVAVASSSESSGPPLHPDDDPRFDWPYD